MIFHRFANNFLIPILTISLGCSAAENSNEQQLIKAAVQDDVASIKGFGDSEEITEWRNKSDWSLLHLASFHGAEKVAGYLIEQGANLTARNSNGETSLHLSALTDHDGIIKLITTRVTSKNSAEAELLQKALVEVDKVVRYLSEMSRQFMAGSDISLSNTVNQLTILRQSADEVEKIARYVTNNTTKLATVLEAEQSEGKTPLFYALNSDKAMTVLIDLGANKFHRDKHGMLPIHQAVVTSNKQAIDMFLFKNFTLKTIGVGDTGKTISHLAAEHNITNFPMDSFDPRAADTLGQIPACWAAINGSLNFAKLMVPKFKNITTGDCVFGQLKYRRIGSPLHVAAYYRHKEYIKLLLEHRANLTVLDSMGGSILHAMALRDSTDTTIDAEIVAMLKRGKRGSIEERDNTGKSPFLVAAESSSLSFAILLSTHGVQVDALDSDGYSALHLTENPAFLEYLRTTVRTLNIESRTNNNDSLTVLLAATRQKHPEVYIRHLINNLKANPSAVNNMGRTAAHIAVEENYLEAIELFMEKNFDFSIADNLGLTALHLAINLNRTEIALVIIGHFSEGPVLLQTVDDTELQNMPLHLAAQNGNTDVLKHLLENVNVQVTALNAKRQTALHLAVAFQHPSAVQLLLSVDNGRRALQIQDNNYGRSPLHVVASSCTPSTLAIASSLVGFINDEIANKKTLKALDFDDWTPMGVAVRHNCFAMIDILVNSHRNVTRLDDPCCWRNKDGLTLVEHAESMGYQLLAENMIRSEICKQPANCVTDVGNQRNRDCGDIPIIVGGMLSHGRTSVGAKRRITCNSNFLSMASETVECGSNGKWIVKGFCLAQNCGEPPMLLHGRLTNGSTSVGAIRIASCDVGYGLSSNRTLTCDYDGTWHTKAICQKVHFNANLFPAAENGSIDDIERLVENEAADVNAKKSTDGATAIFLAAKHGQTETVKLLIDLGAFLDIQTNDGETALMEAVVRNHSEIVRTLLKYGSDANIRQHEDYTPLILAVMHGNGAAARILIEEGNAAIDLTNKYNDTALIFATKLGLLEVLRVLVEKGADVNRQNNNGFSPLVLALQHGKLDVARYLIEEVQADVNLVTRNNDTALSWAAVNGFVEIVRLLVKYGSDVNTNFHQYRMTPLMIAAMDKRENVALFLAEEAGAQVTSVNEHGNTALNFAVKNGMLAVVRALVKKGTDINLQNNDGLTPIILAIQYHQTHVARFLIEIARIDVNLVNKNGDAALNWASSYGALEVIRSLVKNGANVNSRSSSGSTSLMIAIEHDHADVARFLIEEAHTDVNLRNNANDTALMWAVKKNQLSIVQLLVKQGSEVNTNFHKDGFTPLILAVMEKHDDVARFLIEQTNADVNARNVFNNTALMWAAENGLTEIARLLVEKGADINVRSGKGHTALTRAEDHWHTEIASLLKSKMSLDAY